MDEHHLLAPGPTPVPEEARLAMAERLIHHRSDAFREVFRRVRRGLAWIFQTDEDVLTLTCSGTGAFEAAMTNFLSSGSTVLVVGGGKFGERWADVGRRFDLDVVEMDIEWGEHADPAALSELLSRQDDVSMVTVTHSETSTGVLHPLEDLAEVVHRESDALLAVDGITSIGVHDVPMDELGVDLLVGGSQKAFGAPPGLGFVAASARAWRRQPDDHLGGYYFDLARERRRQAQNQTAFTPGISQVLALDVSLEKMQEEGRRDVYDRHALHAAATRAAVEALGLELLAQRPSNAVTAVRAPRDIPAPEIVDRMNEGYGAVIAGGQKHMSSDLFRLGHIGFFGRSDILTMVSSLELSLRDLGYSAKSGEATMAAQDVYATA